MQKPSFSYGGSSFYFDVYFSYPIASGLKSRQRQIRTNGGGRRIQNVGQPAYRQLTFNINNMSEAKFTEMETWFNDVVDWMSNAFFYADHNGNILTVRLLTPDLSNFQIDYLNNVSGTISVEVEE